MCRGKKNQEASVDVQELVRAALNDALVVAEKNYVAGTLSYKLSPTLQNALEDISKRSQKASTGFTNIVTCLAIKVSFPQCDVRYHQVQIQNRTSRPAGFNFRGLSEKIIYPWLSEHSFEGAKSGWQTRTFERPKPYMLDYDENIGDIKKSFLNIFHEIEEKAQPADTALAYLLHLQLIHREATQVNLSIPRTADIQLIIKLLSDHFFYPYKASKGASRLPVLALYAVYTVLVVQFDRYAGMSLKELEEHSAADSQTGAIGDIEVVDANNNVFEAVEVKHNIALSDCIIQDAALKIMNKAVARYYILTTHATCEPSDNLVSKINNIKALYQCQLIANGVIPSLRYYLRLLSDPSAIFPIYVKLLGNDKAIKHEHKEIWNKLAVEGVGLH